MGSGFLRIRHPSIDPCGLQMVSGSWSESTQSYFRLWTVRIVKGLPQIDELHVTEVAIINIVYDIVDRHNQQDLLVF